MEYNQSHHNLEDYQQIQRKVRAYRDQGKTNIPLNSKKADLECELEKLEQQENSGGCIKLISGCIKLIIWTIMTIIFLSSSAESEISFEEAVQGIIGLNLVIGLISPGAAIRFGLPKSRIVIVIVCGILGLIVEGG